MEKKNTWLLIATEITQEMIDELKRG